MNGSAESWLIVLAAGLYLWDSLLLLPLDEFVVIRSGGSRWRAAFGANGWKIARQEPLLLNPLAPWQTVVRIGWQPQLGLTPTGTAAVRLPEVGLLPRIGVTALWMLMFVALPQCLMVVRQTVWTLAVIAAMYATLVVVLASLRRDWIALGLDDRRYRATVLECLLCPPFCINAVRRMTLLQPLQQALSDVARHEGDEGRMPEFKRQLGLRVQERIDAQPDGSEQLPALRAVARTLETGDGQ